MGFRGRRVQEVTPRAAPEAPETTFLHQSRVRHPGPSLTCTQKQRAAIPHPNFGILHDLWLWLVPYISPSTPGTRWSRTWSWEAKPQARPRPWDRDAKREEKELLGASEVFWGLLGGHKAR